MFQYWIRSLSTRLWATSVAALVASLTVIAAIALYGFSHSPPERFRTAENLRMAYRIADGLTFDGSGRPLSVKVGKRDTWLFDAAPTELLYRVLDDSGKVVLASRGSRNSDPWDIGDLASAVGTMRPTTIAGRSFDVVTLEVRHGQAWFFVQSAASEAFNEAALGEKIEPIPEIVGYTLLIAIVVFGLTLTFTVRRVLRPLRQASSAAALITPQNLKTRLSVVGLPSEIKPLLNAFNEALARLENGFAVQQQFLASAAHELQTPLTLLRGEIELQPEIKKKEFLFREIDAMARQVRQLLHLAEVSESQNFCFSDIDRLSVSEDVVDYLSRKADKKRVKLQIDALTAPASVWGDRSALFVLLKNIIENAINASPPDGSVKVFIDERTIRVEDEGTGINPEHFPFLFERFWRAPDAQHDGAGLGLAICREIALAHRWQLTVKNSVRGAEFTVTFA